MPTRPALTHARRPRIAALATAIAAGLAAFAVAAPTATAHPQTATGLGAEIEVYAPYQGQTICDPQVKPGVGKFRALVLAEYGGTGDSGVTRACNVGGRSEHKEGRAWDWRVSVKNDHQVNQVHNLFDWLFATDANGNTDAMARRLGIMYIIWDAKIWNASSDEWSKYHCSGVTDCHRDHVHFSFGWAGARAKTSYWTGQVSPVLDPPKIYIKDKQLPESVTVDAHNPEKTKTWFKLTQGHRYKVTVSGTYTYGYNEFGPLVADGECTVQRDPLLTDSTSLLRLSPFAETAGTDHLDLKAQGKTKWTPVSDNGNGCSSGEKHKYTTTIKMTKTGPVKLRVLDDKYDDNWGELQVKISKP